VPTNDYSARHLSVLEGLEAVRKRPGMYIGSTDSRGLMHCIWEIIDNSVDEALAGHGKLINITLHKDSSIEVSDQARGIPVDIEPKTGLAVLRVFLLSCTPVESLVLVLTLHPVVCTVSVLLLLTPFLNALR